MGCSTSRRHTLANALYSLPLWWHVHPQEALYEPRAFAPAQPCFIPRPARRRRQLAAAWPAKPPTSSRGKHEALLLSRNRQAVQLVELAIKQRCDPRHVLACAAAVDAVEYVDEEEAARDQGIVAVLQEAWAQQVLWCLPSAIEGV